MHNNYENCNRTNSDRDDYKERQTHVHEFTGSTEFAEEGRDRHNHRFAGVTGEAIRYGKSHVYKIKGCIFMQLLFSKYKNFLFKF